LLSFDLSVPSGSGMEFGTPADAIGRLHAVPSQYICLPGSEGSGYQPGAGEGVVTRSDGISDLTGPDAL
jgi:hypothetical protein